MKSFQSPLNALEEQQYLQQLEAGSEDARKILIERNMRLVAHIAKKYQNMEEEMDDLISIGSIGLIKAVSTYKNEKGNRLGTYAARCIENELLMYCRSKKKTARDISLYEPIGTDKEGNQIRLVDVVESPETELWERVVLKKNISQLYAFLPLVLTEREQMIICRRYGLYNTKPSTQREIAAMLHISRSYVSRIEKKALEKLREAFENNGK
ncbi:MAG: RNA polymerase sporulation sigma factor SigK [Eubacterium sp.]